MSIILDKVSYIYGQNTPNEAFALKNISMVIPDGQFIGVIGHTGSGKSTLMQMLNGLIKPTAGDIYFNGEDISQKDFNKKMLRSKVGLVFQYPEHQLFEATVFDDVCFGPRNIGLDKKESQLRAFTALREMGVEEELFYQSPFDLSGGQKRRVAIAGVLAMEPDVLILDEPTAGLDPQGRDEILQQIAHLHSSQHKTILLVSHSMEDVANYAQRILVMNNGELVMDGRPEEIYCRYKELEKMGLGAPQITYVVEELKKRGIPLRTTTITLEDARNEILRVWKGIR